MQRQKAPFSNPASLKFCQLDSNHKKYRRLESNQRSSHLFQRRTPHAFTAPSPIYQWQAWRGRGRPREDKDGELLQLTKTKTDYISRPPLYKPCPKIQQLPDMYDYTLWLDNYKELTNREDCFRRPWLCTVAKTTAHQRLNIPSLDYLLNFCKRDLKSHSTWTENHTGDLESHMAFSNSQELATLPPETILEVISHCRYDTVVTLINTSRLFHNLIRSIP